MRGVLVGAGLAGVAVLVALALVLREGDEAAPPPARPASATTAPPAPELPPPETPVPPPAAEPKGIPSVPAPWRSAGAFVWHEADVDPALLAATMRAHGFAWVAVFLHEGLEESVLVADWVDRFRAAGGPVVGGWGVLRADPAGEAKLAARLLDLHGLGFYVANAEFDYAAEGDPARSAAFVQAFRGLLPELPAALSTLCRPPGGFDLAPWREGGFALLPQAYVNQFGAEVAPAACVEGSAPAFPRERIHPTVGTWDDVEPLDYGAQLAAAGTTGFSVYTAENTREDEWAALGRAIAELGIAA